MRHHLIDISDAWGAHQLRVLEFGTHEAERAIVCVHGLTRNAFDFQALGQALAADGYRVLVPDMVGRGGSTWLADPKGYSVQVYAQHMVMLLDRLKLDEVDWVGTSMGGLIALELAGQSRFRTLVLNDIGAFVPRAALEMIKSYLELDLVFEDINSLERHLRLVHAPFGPLTDQEWAHLAQHSARPDQSEWRLHYDPEIRVNFNEAALRDIELWDQWQAIDCPTLILRGEESLLFDRATMTSMVAGRDHVRTIEIAGVGHAPALMDRQQIDHIRNFLTQACRSSAG